MDIDDTFTFTAPPEVVFNSLTDPDRAQRWLPSGVRAEPRDGTGVRLVTAGTSAAFDIATDPQRLQLTWRSADDRGVHGQARVGDAPAGGSEVHVRLSLPGDGIEEGHARAVLAETMRHLQRDVSDNFNAG